MEPLAIARRGFTAYLLGDKPGVAALAHPESTWIFPGDPAVVPWAGEWHGEAITRVIDLFIDHLDYQEARVDTAFASGDRVFVEAYERYVVRATGRVCENRLAGVFTIRDGKIWRYAEYSDTAAMERALG